MTPQPSATCVLIDIENRPVRTSATRSIGTRQRNMRKSVRPSPAPSCAVLGFRPIGGGGADQAPPGPGEAVSRGPAITHGRFEPLFPSRPALALFVFLSPIISLVGFLRARQLRETVAALEDTVRALDARVDGLARAQARMKTAAPGPSRPRARPRPPRPRPPPRPNRPAPHRRPRSGRRPASARPAADRAARASTSRPGPVSTAGPGRPAPVPAPVVPEAPVESSPAAATLAAHPPLPVAVPPPVEPTPPPLPAAAGPSPRVTWPPPPPALPRPRVAGPCRRVRRSPAGPPAEPPPPPAAPFDWESMLGVRGAAWVGGITLADHGRSPRQAGLRPRLLHADPPGHRDDHGRHGRAHLGRDRPAQRLPAVRRRDLRRRPGLALRGLVHAPTRPSR